MGVVPPDTVISIAPEPSSQLSLTILTSSMVKICIPVISLVDSTIQPFISVIVQVYVPVERLLISWVVAPFDHE